MDRFCFNCHGLKPEDGCPPLKSPATKAGWRWRSLPKKLMLVSFFWIFVFQKRILSFRGASKMLPVAGHVGTVPLMRYTTDGICFHKFHWWKDGMVFPRKMNDLGVHIFWNYLVWRVLWQTQSDEWSHQDGIVKAVCTGLCLHSTVSLQTLMIWISLTNLYWRNCLTPISSPLRKSIGILKHARQSHPMWCTPWMLVQGSNHKWEWAPYTCHRYASNFLESLNSTYKNRWSQFRQSQQHMFEALPYP